jgi:thiamine pyrophosphate-dependent acetolactate synthase large subunit-like protein
MRPRRCRGRNRACPRRDSDAARAAPSSCRFRTHDHAEVSTTVANTLLLDNALATMGAGLPSAMMAAMLYQDRRVLAVCGDGGFMMNSQEMETAVRLGLNLVVLVLEDGAYGMIRWKQSVDAFPDFGMNFGNPDFVRYAEAYARRGIVSASPKT